MTGRVSVDRHRSFLPDGAVPTNATQLAVLAIDISDVFLERSDEANETVVVEPDLDVVRAALLRGKAR